MALSPVGGKKIHSRSTVYRTSAAAFGWEGKKRCRHGLVFLGSPTKLLTTCYTKKSPTKTTEKGPKRGHTKTKKETIFLFSVFLQVVHCCVLRLFYESRVEETRLYRRELFFVDNSDFRLYHHWKKTRQVLARRRPPSSFEITIDWIELVATTTRDLKQNRTPFIPLFLLLLLFPIFHYRTTRPEIWPWEWYSRIAVTKKIWPRLPVVD